MEKGIQTTINVSILNLTFLLFFATKKVFTHTKRSGALVP